MRPRHVLHNFLRPLSTDMFTRLHTAFPRFSHRFSTASDQLDLSAIMAQRHAAIVSFESRRARIAASSFCDSCESADAGF
jgi:hypothetical protein